MWRAVTSYERFPDFIPSIISHDVRRGEAGRAVIDCGLVDSSVRPELNRPDTKHMPEDARVFHMRRAVADAIETPLFAFALRLFEGANTDQTTACDRFLRRLLKGCGGAVYCSIGEPPGSAKAYEKMTDSKLAGAALFLRVFLVRFAKRFPQQHGFVHPVVDAPETRERLIETLGAGFQSWSFLSATKSTPAAIVVRMTNDGVRSLVRAPQPHSWIAVNHFYEFCVTQPSRELSGHPSIFIIDLQALTFGIYTSSNIKAIAGQLIAAMFHPEPFSAFVVAHATELFAFTPPPSPGGAAAAPSPEDFSDFILNDVCVGEHVLELLRAQDIGSIETLRMLNLDDLRAIPGLALGPRRKLHEAITELRDGGVT